MEKEKSELLDIKTLEQIDELQNMMRDINSDTYAEIQEKSLNLFSHSKEMIYSYFNSLKSMRKSRENKIDLYTNLGATILSKCDFISDEDLKRDEFNIHTKTVEKVEIKTQSDELRPTIDKIEQIIREDDIEKFQSIISHTNLNTNSEMIVITTKSDEQNKKETTYTLIEYAALNSSIKIFKFLLLNLDKKVTLNEKLYNYAINGNNFDIIHLIEKEFPQLKKQSSLYKSISLHQNQIAQYLLENFDFLKLDIKSGIKSVKAFNIEFLLKYLNSIKGNETKETLNPLFFESVKTRQLGLIQFFLLNYQNFIEINQSFYSKKFKRFLTPLIFSIKMKFNEIAVFLMDQKKIILQYSDEEYEPDALNTAIKTKNYEIIEKLLKKPSIRINNLDFNYYAPIHYSIFVKDFRIFSMLIQLKNADILLRGGNNETIFHYAAYNSFIEIFEYALKNCPEKFDVKAKNIYGIFFIIFLNETAVHFAAKDNQVEALKYFYNLAKNNVKLCNYVIFFYFLVFMWIFQFLKRKIMEN